MVEWMFGQTVRLIGQGTDCEIVDNGRMTKTVHPMAYFEYWGIKKDSFSLLAFLYNFVQEVYISLSYKISLACSQPISDAKRC